jgi:hypothetical protein
MTTGAMLMTGESLVDNGGVVSNDWPINPLLSSSEVLGEL